MGSNIVAQYIQDSSGNDDARSKISYSIAKLIHIIPAAESVAIDGVGVIMGVAIFYETEV